MRRRRGIWIFVLLAAAVAAAALGAHASSAAPGGGTGFAATLDKTYSCPVSSERYVSLNASVTLPPVNNRPQPGVLSVSTGVNVSTQNGTTVVVSQFGLEAAKNTLRIDTSSCHRVKQQIPLKPKGLPGPPTTITKKLFGRFSTQCTSTARVLIRLRLTTANHTPSHAVLAIRDQNAKSRPVAFVKWSPRKISLYTARGCLGSG
jgi:hypothetical protein